MKESSKSLSPDQAAVYQIKVQGKLGETWSEWFEGMQIDIEGQGDGSPVTILSGKVTDQAALFGLLSRIRDLGLPLLLVERLEVKQL